MIAVDGEGIAATSNEGPGIVDVVATGTNKPSLVPAMRN